MRQGVRFQGGAPDAPCTGQAFSVPKRARSPGTRSFLLYGPRGLLAAGPHRLPNRWRTCLLLDLAPGGLADSSMAARAVSPVSGAACPQVPDVRATSRGALFATSQQVPRSGQLSAHSHQWRSPSSRGLQPADLIHERFPPVSPGRHVLPLNAATRRPMSPASRNAGAVVPALGTRGCRLLKSAGFARSINHLRPHPLEVS